jgi:hypothetical protein
MLLAETIDERVRHRWATMGQGGEAMARWRNVAASGVVLAGEGRASQLGQNLARGSPFAACPLPDRQEHVFVDVDCRAHSSDASASTSGRPLTDPPEMALLGSELVGQWGTGEPTGGSAVPPGRDRSG